MANTGEKYPTLGVTVSESPWSDNTWTYPTRIYSDDARYASVTASSYDTGDQTYVLKATGFDFSSIPDGSTIDGVICYVNAYHANGAASMDLMQLLDADKARVGTNQCETPVSLGTGSAGIVSKGNDHDTWGNSLTTALVKDSDFGVGLGFLAVGLNADVFVDYVTLDVYYTPAAVTEELAGELGPTASVAGAARILRRVGAEISSTASFTVGLTVTAGVVIESLAGGIAATSGLASLIKRTRGLTIPTVSTTVVIGALHRLVRRYGVSVSVSANVAAFTRVIRILPPEPVEVSPVISEPYPKRRRTLYTWRPGMPPPQ